MASSEEIRLVVKSEVNSAISDLKKLNSEMNNSSSQSVKTSKGFSALEAAALGAAAMIGSSLASAMGDAVDKAASLDEEINKTSLAFTGQIPLAEAAIKELTASYAMSTLEATKLLGSMQTMLKPMGLGTEEAAKMSVTYTKLAADMGSLMNVPTAQVMDDIKSALAGSSETLYKYGIVANETTLKQIAMNNGMKVGADVMQSDVRARALHIALLEKTKDAQGDMIRTADSYANVQKKMKAVTDEVAVAFGQQLLPALKDSMKGVISNQDAFTSLAKSAGNIVAKVIDIGNSLVAMNKMVVTGVQIGVEYIALGINKALKTLSDKFGDMFSALAKAGVPGMTAMAEKMNGVFNSSEDKIISNKKEIENLEKSFSKSGDTIANVYNRWSKESDDNTNKFKLDENAKGQSMQATTLVSQGEMAKRKQQQIELTTYINEAFLTQEQLELNQEMEKGLKLFNIQSMTASQRVALEEAYQKKIQAIRDKAQLNYVNSFVAATQQVTSQLTNIMNLYYSGQNTRLDQDYQKKRAAIEANVKDEKQRTQQLAGLDADYQRKKSSLAREMAIRKKALDITMAIQNTALGITRAFAEAGPFGGPIMAGIIGALGAAQIGLIASQPIPAAEMGGLIKGSPGGTILRAGEKGKSEAIIPLENSGVMEKLGGSKNEYHFHDCFFANENWPSNVIDKVDKELYKYKIEGQSRLF